MTTNSRLTFSALGMLEEEKKKRKRNVPLYVLSKASTIVHTFYTLVSGSGTCGDL